MKLLPVEHMKVLYFIIRLDLEKYLSKKITSSFFKRGSFEWFCTKIPLDLYGLSLALQWQHLVSHVQGKSQDGTILFEGISWYVSAFMRIEHLEVWHEIISLRISHTACKIVFDSHTNISWFQTLKVGLWKRIRHAKLWIHTLEQCH
jgi:hypothetical protein